MKPFKLIASIVGASVVLGVVVSSIQAQEKEGMPEKFEVGNYELNLLWQKDLNQVFGQPVTLGASGGIGHPISISKDGQYIGVNTSAPRNVKQSLSKEEKKDRFWLLDREGRILWSKTHGKKQTGVISKNGSTVLIEVVRGELDTEFFIYDTKGKLIGHGRDPCSLSMSGNGEYILSFSDMVGHRAVLYNKNGQVMWKHEFENPWGGNAKIMDSGDVVINDTGEILFITPGGRVMWRWPDVTDTLIFDIPDDATAKEPNIVIFEEMPRLKDWGKNTMSLLKRGRPVWECHLRALGTDAEYFSVSFSKNAKRLLTHGWKKDNEGEIISGFFVWAPPADEPIVQQAVDGSISDHDIHPSGNFVFVLGSMLDENLSIEDYLILYDLTTNKWKKVSSSDFALESKGFYLAMGSYDTDSLKILLYSIARK